MSGHQLVKFTSGFYPKWSDALVKRYADAFEIPLKKRFRDIRAATRPSCGCCSHSRNNPTCLFSMNPRQASILW